MKVGILGGGLSGISIAYFLQNVAKIKRIEILEREGEPGGLCRSFNVRGINCDIGPHVIFSKDDEMLDLMISVLGENVCRIKRSNKIYYKGRFIKYPLENDLSALPEEERNFCVKTFLNNPYANIEAKNLWQYFLKTFGEGMTDIYFRPYNSKIWKYDVSLMDTQMIDRIPNPPKTDIMKSASGISTEGYLHQLYFYYPRQGGIHALIKAFQARFGDKIRVIVDSEVLALRRLEGLWRVTKGKGVSEDYDLVISTIPIPSLVRLCNGDMPSDVIQAASHLKYNSIMITVVGVDEDYIGDHFAVLVPDEDIIFHRVSKLNFLGEAYHHPASSLLMVEITYRKNDPVDKMSAADLREKIIVGLKKVNLIGKTARIHFMETKKVEYAYIIYDLNHKRNVDLVRKYFYDQGVHLCGRFGEFEYLNMDSVIRHAKVLSRDIEKRI